jgi:hypothetical protein
MVRSQTKLVATLPLASREGFFAFDGVNGVTLALQVGFDGVSNGVSRGSVGGQSVPLQLLLETCIGQKLPDVLALTAHQTCLGEWATPPTTVGIWAARRQ